MVRPHAAPLTPPSPRCLWRWHHQGNAWSAGRRLIGPRAGPRPMHGSCDLPGEVLAGHCLQRRDECCVCVCVWEERRRGGGGREGGESQDAKEDAKDPATSEHVKRDSTMTCQPARRQTRVWTDPALTKLQIAADNWDLRCAMTTRRARPGTTPSTPRPTSDRQGAAVGWQPVRRSGWVPRSWPG